MNYLDPSEYSAFGLPNMSLDKIDNACAVVDAYLSRPEGIAYTADANGYPLFMTRKLPESSFKLTAAISAGTNVPASISNGALLSVGSALVLDKATSAIAETTYVTQIIDANHVILSRIEHAHAINGTLEDGLTVDVAMRVAKGRAYVTLPSGPIRRLISAVGRVSYPRRGDSLSAISPQANGLLATVSSFGGAPTWQIINVANNDIDLEKNQIWTPMGFLMSPYSEVRMSYIAGYPSDNIPMGIKRAVANIAKAVDESPAGASVSKFRAGDVQMERFVDSIIDEDLRMMLAPFRASIYA
jgi:hypothetical protein